MGAGQPEGRVEAGARSAGVANTSPRVTSAAVAGLGKVLADGGW